MSLTRLRRKKNLEQKNFDEYENIKKIRFGECENKIIEKN